MSHPDFELFNPLQPGQKKSRLQHLTDICAFREEWAMEAAERLEMLDGAYVAIFFQLPRAIMVEDVPYLLPAQRKGTNIEFRVIPFLLESVMGSNVAIKTSPAKANATQIIAYVPLWGKWAEVYQRYARCFTAHGLTNEIVWSNKEYWEGQTLRAKDFEIKLSSRLIPEVIYALRRLLKAYSVIVKRQFADVEWMYGAFMMPYPCRISQFRDSTPLLNHFLHQRTSEPQETIDAVRIRDGVGFAFRELSRFETQIFELNRLVSSGSYALALTGSQSLVEWVLKLLAPESEKEGSLHKLTLYFASKGLGDDRFALDELRVLRNEATHLGEEANRGDKRPHEITNFDIDQVITEETARRSIDLAWRIFQKANSGVLTR